jgi:tetratricopeptide (TPR) repeat protein
MYRIDPTSKYGFAAGFTAFRSRSARGALTRFLKVDIDLPCQREWVPWWTYTTATYHMLGRYDDELALARRGLDRFPDQMGMYDAEIRAWAARGDIQAIDSLLALLSQRPPVPGAPFGARPLLAALELREHGYPAEVDRLLGQSIDWFAGRPASEARADRGQAFLAAGRWGDADTLFTAVTGALTASNSVYIGYLGDRGVALAHLGEVDSARAQMRRLEQVPGPRVMAAYAGPARAAITAALGDSQKAIELLDEAYRNGYPYGVSLHESVWWHPLRSIPQFRDVIRPR